MRSDSDSHVASPFKRGDSVPSPRRAVSAARPALLTSAFIRLLALQACFGSALAAFILVPKFVAVELSGSPQQIGNVMATFSFANVLALPLIGAAVDRLGRGSFLVAGNALMLAASLGFLWVESVGVWLYALRALQGIGFACVYIAASALVVDHAPRQRLTQALALFGATMQGTNALIPFLAERISEQWSWSLVFGFAAALSGGATLLSLQVPEGHVGRAPTSRATGLAAFARRPAALRSAGVMVAVGVALAAMTTFIQPYALEKGIRQVGGFFLAFSATAMATRITLGAWIDRTDLHRTCTLATLVYIAVLFGTSELTGTRMLWLGVLLGFGHGIFLPAFSALNLQRASERDRGKIVAVVSGGFNVGLAVGTLGLGHYASLYGYAPVFGLAAACMLVAFFLLLVFRGAARWSPTSEVQPM